MPNEVRVRTSVPGAKQSTKEVHDLRSAFDTLQKKGAKGFAIGAGAAITAKGLSLVGSVAGGVVDEIGDMLEAGSDLNESMGKSQVVFGDSADEMEAWADRAADAFGISKQAALDAGANFGQFFQGAGKGAAEAEKMSEQLLGLAADLRSFNNLDSVEDALARLQSGLSGESEPLRKVGVFLTEAKVKAKGMELGLADAHGELTEGEKILARYQIILDETKNAQGDFARTSEGVANTEERKNAAMANAEARLGQKILPLQKAWIDLQIATLGALGDSIDQIDQEQLALKALQRQGIEPSEKAIREWLATNGRIPLENPKVVDTIGDGTRGFKDLDTAASGANDTFKRTGTSSGTLRRMLQDLGYEADELDDAIGDLADTISDDLFGDAINAGNEQRLKTSIKDLKDQRDEVKKGSPKWVELTGEIAENQQALWELHREQAEEKGPKALLEFLIESRKRHNKNTGAIDAEIERLQILLGLATRFNDLGTIGFGRYGGKTIPDGGGKVTGGPVTAGTAYTVGENGPETFVAPTNGTIIPNGGTGGGGISGYVPVPVPASWSPSQQQAYANEAGPAIARWMQQRGMLPRGASI